MKKIIDKITKSKAKIEDVARQEYILNLILLATIIMTGVSLLADFIQMLRGGKNSLSLILIFIILVFFISLLYISKKGYNKISSYLLIGSIILLAFKMGWCWGIDLPAEILFYTLAIIMSSILISGVSSFILTIICLLSFSLISYLQSNHLIIVDRNWIYELWNYSDIIAASLILFVIATITWLSNREMEKALTRAYQSEKELKVEKNNLEIRVEEKTRELKIVQAEEVARVHRLAELGQLSGGLFHDLVNPLTTVILNIEKMQNDQKNNNDLKDIGHDLNQVSIASKKMEEFIAMVRKQIKPQGYHESFCLNEEIESAITILNYKSKKEKVAIIFSADKKIIMSNNSIKFNQIVTNLISNAIDSYTSSTQEQREVLVDLTRVNNDIVLDVTDCGEGISEDNLKKIFEPFFSTKLKTDNLGLGLSLIKNITEKDFNGEIKVSSKLGIGSQFSIVIPLIKI